MIRSFKDSQTEAFFKGEFVRTFGSFEAQALKRLLWLNAAKTLQDLREIRSNRLEALKGDRRGQFSIRINDQWRVCFRWKDDHALDVEIVEYH
jgi:proteic killer suppression protein